MTTLVYGSVNIFTDFSRDVNLPDIDWNYRAFWIKFFVQTALLISPSTETRQNKWLVFKVNMLICMVELVRNK